MKRYRLIQTACLAALAVGFASCSQDELSSLTEGVEGAPVTFNASGIAMTQVETRATVDGTWEDGMSVAVKIGSVVKEYAVTPNADDPKRATLAAADGVTPFVWASITEKKDVQAWYPYTAGETTMPDLMVQQDQSIEANYLASDLLSVSKQVTYGDNILQFAHRTAKITLRLEVAQGSTASMENAQVILHNLSTANGNPGLITCFDASAGDTYIHNALIAPQTFTAGKELLKIVLSDGTVFGYVPDKAVNFDCDVLEGLAEANVARVDQRLVHVENERLAAVDRRRKLEVVGLPAEGSRQCRHPAVCLRHGARDFVRSRVVRGPHLVAECVDPHKVDDIQNANESK